MGCAGACAALWEGKQWMKRSILSMCGLRSHNAAGLPLSSTMKRLQRFVLTAMQSADLFHVPQWSLSQSSAGHMVLLRDGYPVAQGSESTCLLHPHLPQAFIQARRCSSVK